MRRGFRKISNFILLLTFVLTALSSVPGFAWCIGEDGHFEIEYVIDGNCDTASSSSGGTAVVSSLHIDEDHCGSCLDVYLQPHDVFSAKRLNYEALNAPDVFALGTILSSTSQADRQVKTNLVPQPPPRILQSILNHRTTVLLI